MRLENDIRKRLCQDIEIPQHVMSRMDETIASITGDAVKKRTYARKRKGLRYLSMPAACAALAVLIMGGSVCAYTIWNRFADERYGITEEKREDLKKDKVLNDQNVKVTHDGLTVECVETIASGPYAHILLKITAPEELPIRDGIGFEHIDVLENGLDSVSWCGGMSEAGDAQEGMAGEAVVDEEDHAFYYEIQTMINDIILDKGKNERKNPNKEWDGQQLTLLLKDYSRIEKVSENCLLKGEWKLDIPMKASEKQVEMDCDEEIGYKTWVKGIRLSPISLHIDYSYPKLGEMKKLKVIGEDGKETARMVDAREEELPEQPTAVEYKDGSRQKLEEGMGSAGYVDSDFDKYEYDFILEKVVDVDQVKALYFSDKKIELR